MHLKIKFVHLPTSFHQVYQQKLRSLGRAAAQQPMGRDLARGVHGQAVVGAHLSRTHSGRTCSEPNCPMPWNGGPVQHTPQVNILFWGPVWGTTADTSNAESYVANFFNGIGNTSEDVWSPIMNQYYDGSGNVNFNTSTPVLVGLYGDSSVPPSGATQSNFDAEDQAFVSFLAANSGHYGTNVNNIIMVQPGTCPYQFAAGCPGGNVYCAWHSYDSGTHQPYTNLPYQPDAGGSCGENIISGEFDGFSIVGGHEFAETVTDPLINSWVDGSDPFGGEIGDKCAWVNIGFTGLSNGFWPTQPLYSNSEYFLNGNGCTQNEFDLSLGSTGSSFSVGQSVTLSASTNIDVLPTPWFIVIYDLTTASVLHACGSGTLCQATVTGDTAHSESFVAVISHSNATDVKLETGSTGATWNPASTTTGVTASATTAGGSTTVHVTVGGAFPGAGVAAPSGSVTVSDGTHTCGATLSGANGSSTGSCTLPEPHAGGFTVHGSFAGDANFLASSGSVGLTVGKATSATTLTASKLTILFGSENKEVFKVHVTGAGGPTGQVRIMKGLTVLCTATLAAGSGHCSPKAKALKKGKYSIFAKYFGDANDLTSVSTAVHITVK